MITKTINNNKRETILTPELQKKIVNEMITTLNYHNLNNSEYLIILQVFFGAVFNTIFNNLKNMGYGAGLVSKTTEGMFKMLLQNMANTFDRVKDLHLDAIPNIDVKGGKH